MPIIHPPLVSRKTNRAMIIKGVDHFLIAALFIAVLSFAPARAQEPRLVKPGEATSGTLLLPASEAGFYVEAPLLASNVEIAVSGPIARTRVTQRFENPSDGWIEAVYVFPLPDESAVDTLKMQIGDRLIEGVVKERKKAKAIYEAAKREGKKASLLEQERPNIFTNAVANIGPGESVVVQIEYQESVKLEDGKFSLRFPMVVGPRFNPPPLVHNVSFSGGGWGVFDPVPDRARIEPPVLHPDAGPVNRAALSVDIDAGFPIGEIKSSYHKIAVDRPEPAQARLTLADEAVPANRDFELIWSPKAGLAPSAALFKEVVDGEPYYLLMITPPAGEAAAPPPPREAIFVIDVSGSMGGQSIRQARESLLLALKRLKPGDAFNIIKFNDRYETLYPSARPVDPETIGAALNYVSGLGASGGTMMLPALEAALADRGAGGDRLRQVVFLTDGAIGNERQLFEAIAQRRGDARIFTVGIGSAPNSYFMSRAAEIGQGAFTHIGAVSEVSERMSALFAKLEAPAVTNIRARWPKDVKVEAWPSPIPDLYKGEVLVVAARAPDAKGALAISGEEAGAAWKIDIPLAQASERPGISKLWARKKIASLELGRARPGADGEALDGAILKTALTHKLISRLTSLVAVDVTPSRPDGETLARANVPLNLPEGWDFDKVFGSSKPPLQREAFAPGVLKTRVAAAEAAPAPAGQGSSGLALPQGASLADMQLLRGLILIALAMLVFALHWRGRRVSA